MECVGGLVDTPHQTAAEFLSTDVSRSARFYELQRPTREFQEVTMSGTVKATPEGTRTVTPNLIFNEASRAIEFY
jgi:hypothetical protein